METQYLKDISNFCVAGINYKKSDASVRGQFAVTNEQYLRILQKASEQGIDELFILSTCNRTEIYGFAYCSHQLAELLCSETSGDFNTFKRSAYIKTGERAIEHVFNVGAGLDSQILGSPDSTNVKDVKRYLDEFLMDERVIDKPWLLRTLLVKGIIVPFRAPKSAEAYKSIWTEKGSPLIVISKQQRDALQQQIEEPVAIAMRYGNPSPKAAFDELLQKNPDLEEVIAVPMYPHYAMSSYETAIEYAIEQHRKGRYRFKLTTIKPYYNNEGYIHALCESIRPHLEREWDHVLFSYHGVPERHIYKGDITGQHCLKVPNCCDVASPAHQYCYRHQCWATTKIVTERLNIPKEKFTFSFQSRLGRDPWLQPYTAQKFEELPKEGVKKLVVVCPAFVSDCLETLEEIAVEGKETFLHAGGEKFEMIPCLNVHPLWIGAMAKWIKEYIGGKEEMILKN